MGSSVNQCSFSRSSRERESIARVFQRIDARQSAGDVLIPTWRLNSTMRIAMGCCETDPNHALQWVAVRIQEHFRRAGADARRVQSGVQRETASRGTVTARVRRGATAFELDDTHCVEVKQRGVLPAEEESQRETAAVTLSEEDSSVRHHQ